MNLLFYWYSIGNLHQVITIYFTQSITHLWSCCLLHSFTTLSLYLMFVQLTPTLYSALRLPTSCARGSRTSRSACTHAQTRLADVLYEWENTVMPEFLFMDSVHCGDVERAEATKHNPFVLYLDESREPKSLQDQQLYLTHETRRRALMSWTRRSAACCCYSPAAARSPTAAKCASGANSRLA